MGQISWPIPKHTIILGVCCLGSEDKLFAGGDQLYKSPHAVCEHIEGGRDQVLFKRCVKEKVDKIMHDDQSEEL